MIKISLSPKLTLAFGLTWEQRDEFVYSTRAWLQKCRTDGYTAGGIYKHPGGDVYGLFKPASELEKNAAEKVIAGAGVIATHPAVQGKTCVVLIEFKDPNNDGQPSVIFVGLKDGRVRTDLIIPPEKIAEVRQQFTREWCKTGQAPLSYGVLQAPNSVDEAFGFEELTPRKGGGKPIKLEPLRATGGLIAVGVGSLVLLAAGVGLELWQNQIDAADAMRKRIAASQNDPAVLYQKEVARWLERPVHFAAPSIAAVRDRLSNFPMYHAGWIVKQVSCENTQCAFLWNRQRGTLKDFKASAPADWQNIRPVGQTSLGMQIDLTLPVGKLDKTSWPTASDAVYSLLTHWQRLFSIGWKAELGSVPVQQALPPGLSAEHHRTIANIPDAPWGIPLTVKDQPWWFANVDALSPVSLAKLGEQVELTEPIVVQFDGKSINFSFGGTVYVKK